jgi:HlyD family secretion protein
MKRIRLSLLLLPGLLCGCSDPPPAKSPISLDPTVKVVHALPRTVVRTVEQPGVIGAYERTGLYAKVSGFVKKWNVDIGDRVKKGATLVELDAPDIVAQHQQAQAQVVLDKALVDQSHKLHLVAQRNVMAASEMVAQAKADVNRWVADVKRWDSEVKRLTGLVAERVVDQQVLDETQRQLQSGQASLEASRAAVKTRDAQRQAAEATTEKTTTDISAAEARVKVAEADVRRLKALVDYLTITAPYDGVVYARNVNLGDFVLPSTGDPTQGSFSLGVSPSKATPLYVINRIDPVLFVVGVPEADSAYVAAGDPVFLGASTVGVLASPLADGPFFAASALVAGRTSIGNKARVRVPALARREFTARVTRTSWALDSTSRTLMAQIDIANPKGEFVPGMYAYGSVIIERKGVRAVPLKAVTHIGNQTYCYFVEDGKAVQTEVQIGVSDGSWVEVTGKLVRPAGSSQGTWEAFDGTEAVIVGDLSELSNGAPVHVDSGK